jgi:GntR family transcriptional regulator
VTINLPQDVREPKYYAVKRHLLELTDALEPGAPVPTERDLAAEFQTSRTTVRQALVELVAEGRLMRRQGSGTYVADAKITWPLHLASFTQQAATNGFAATSQLLGMRRVAASPELADRLGLRVGDPVHRIERLRLADGRPTAAEVSLLSVRRFPNLARKMRSATSLHALLVREFGVVFRHGEASIETVPAAPREAALLASDVGSPMLVVNRRSFDADGTVVDSGTSWFRGDRITLLADLTAPG